MNAFQVFGECAVYDAEQLLKDPGDTLEGASNVAKKEHCSKTVSNIVDSQNTDDEHGETASKRSPYIMPCGF